MTPPPLVPRRALFDNPQRRAARVSPDGRHLSWLAPDEGVLNVFVAEAAAPEQARALTRDRGRGVPDHAWAFTSRHVLHVQDVGGDENWQVLVTTVEDGVTKELSPPGSLAQIIGLSPRLPTKVVLAINDRDPEHHDAWLVDVESGERTLLAINDAGLAGFDVDLDLKLRLGTRVLADGGREILRRGADGSWTPWITIGLEDADTTETLGYDASGALLATDSRGRDTAALVPSHERGRATVIFESAEADAGDVLVHPVTKEPQAVAVDRFRPKWHALDAAVGAEIAILDDSMDGDVHVASRTLDDRTWIVREARDSGPDRFWLRDRDAHETRFLFTTRPALQDVRLSHMHPVAVPSRDGLDLVSYLSLPHWLDESGRPTRPLPAVLLVHGGPWHRDRWGFDPFHQLLADRGMAVLSVNYRGSTGFGKAFLNAGNGEWGRRMQDDLEDAVAWMVAEGVADPARVAIMGGSYGGYATLVGMTRTPELFACGVDIVGVSNLLTFLDSIPPYWKPLIATWTQRVADPSTDAGLATLRDRSPLSRVDAIRRPLLIAQGANDPRVKKAESDQIVEAMQRHGIPVTYCLFPDEGHGFRRPPNNLAFMAVAEAFLARHLGCRSAPLDPSDFAGSSLQVPVGAGGIPGLPEALADAART
jgi:dipeptidyl aminopeptidase/acylaminoacyl peptidase